jgi:hypothetical protein
MAPSSAPVQTASSSICTERASGRTIPSATTAPTAGAWSTTGRRGPQTGLDRNPPLPHYPFCHYRYGTWFDAFQAIRSSHDRALIRVMGVSLTNRLGARSVRRDGFTALHQLQGRSSRATLSIAFQRTFAFGFERAQERASSLHRTRSGLQDRAHAALAMVRSPCRCLLKEARAFTTMQKCVKQPIC